MIARYCLPVLAMASLWAAGCAQEPMQPYGSADLARELRASIDAHARRARDYQQRGDLAAAEVQWHIVTLLAPRDEAFRRTRSALQAAIAKAAAESYQAGVAALRRGDADAATQAMLRVLALQPEHAEAAQMLRDLERQRMVRIQAERVARARRADNGAVARAPAKASAAPADARQTYDLEQRLDLYASGDYTGGLRELQSYLENNPEDRTARRRIASLVDQEARKLEARGERARALKLYEQAAGMRLDPAAWEDRMRGLRQALAADYYDRGVRIYPSDIGQAIRHWETALRYDPLHESAALHLREARLLQQRLRSSDAEPAAAPH